MALEERCGHHEQRRHRDRDLRQLDFNFCEHRLQRCRLVREQQALLPAGRDGRLPIHLPAQTYLLTLPLCLSCTLTIFLASLSLSSAALQFSYVFIFKIRFINKSYFSSVLKLFSSSYTRKRKFTLSVLDYSNRLYIFIYF